MFPHKSGNFILDFCKTVKNPKIFCKFSSRGLYESDFKNFKNFKKTLKNFEAKMGNTAFFKKSSPLKISLFLQFCQARL